MEIKGFREADILECCGNCKHLRGYGLRSYACKLDIGRPPSVLYSEDDDDGLTAAYYRVCDSFELHNRVKTNEKKEGG